MNTFDSICERRGQPIAVLEITPHPLRDPAGAEYVANPDPVRVGVWKLPDEYEGGALVCGTYHTGRDAQWHLNKGERQAVAHLLADRDRLAAELLAAKADGMPSDRDALQALLDSAYNKGRDDVHALYQTGAPIALLQGELLAVREELGRARSALTSALKRMEHDWEKIESEWGIGLGIESAPPDDIPEILQARAALSQPTKTGGG